jgi:AraC-like DNA-binding protein
VQDTTVAAPSHKTFRTIADGTPGLIFYRSQDGELLKQFDKQLPPVFLYGQGTAYSEIAAPGRLDLMGIYFQPQALRVIFGMDSNEITNDCLDVDTLSTSPLSERLLDAACPARQAQMLTDFLLGLLKRNGAKEDDATKLAVSKIVEKKGNVGIRELCRSLYLSERSLERKFLQNIGIAPKVFLRIQRFQNSLAQIRQNGYQKLTDIAYDNAYSDQSHFLRDFKAFTGFSPTQYLKNTREVVANFSQVTV